MGLRIYEAFQSAVELIDLVMQLRICLNQVFHGLFILFSGLIGIIEVLVENILDWILLLALLLLLLLLSLIGNEVITDLRKVGFKYAELLDEQPLHRVELRLSLL